MRLRTSSSADLLELIPYLLGFQPSDSVVLVVIRDRTVALAARVDLPPIEAAAELVDRFAGIAQAHEASSLLLCGFSPDPESVRAVLRALTDGLAEFGLVDVIHADGSRWWSMLCTDSCCPGEGTAYDPGSGRLAAEAVYAGLSTRSSRADIQALVTGPPSSEEPQLREVVEWAARELANETRPDRQRRIAAMVADYLAYPGPLSDAECARFALLVTDLEVRDTAWSMMSRQRALDHTELWQQVVSRTVSPLERGPLGLLGMAGWLSGNGTLMVCCIERLSRIDPGYTMGSLLDDINQRALSPEVWDSMAESLRAAVA